MTTPAPAKDKIILPLDVPGEAAALQLVAQLAGQITFYKIGLELFTRCGPGIVERIREAARAANGATPRIFLDLKLHDIPNTVAGAVRAAASLEVDLLTVHLCGGGNMLRAAAAAAGLTKLLGVSVLTSSDETTLRETGVNDPVPTQVMRLAALGATCGVHGVVASPHETGILRARFGPALIIVTPGVRPAGGSASDDQRRVLTPRAAIEAGADYLVIGRPITGQSDPAGAAARIIEEIAEAGSSRGGR